MSTEGTDESLEVEGILDDLNHSEDGFIDNCHLVGGKSIEDEDFPSYKTVVLGDSSRDRNVFDGMLNIYSKFDRSKYYGVSLYPLSIVKYEFQVSPRYQGLQYRLHTEHCRRQLHRLPGDLPILL